MSIPNWDNHINKIISKGCPQGSIFGPEFWDIIFDPILEILNQNDNVMCAIAYADDLLLLIEGDSRAQLEERGRRAMESLDSWCEEAKLRVATAKTNYMFLKGSLKRDPTIKHQNTPIRRLQTIKYLGVHVDETLRFRTHVEVVRTKGENLLMKIARLGQGEFRLPLNIVRLYNNALLLSVVGYAAGVWAHRARDIK